MLANMRKHLRPIRRFAQTLYSRRDYILFQFDLSGAIPSRAATVPVVFRQAMRDEVNSFLKDPSHEVPRYAVGMYQELLDLEEPFLIGVLDGRIVYHAWAVRKRWRIAGPHYLKLGRGKATLLGALTVKELRGKGVYPAALLAHLEDLKRQGVSTAFGIVEPSNAASIRGLEKAGFHRLGLYQVRRLGGRVSLRIAPELRRAVEADWPE